MAKFTADYSIPIYIGDVSFGGSFFYLKRLLFNPHFDYALAGKNELFSAGAEFLLDLNSILWLEWPCSVGASWSYNAGKGFESISKKSGIQMDRDYWGFVFNVSF